VNKKQAAYLLGRGFYNNYDIIYLTFAAAAGVASVQDFIRLAAAPKSGDASGIIDTVSLCAAGAVTGFMTLFFLKYGIIGSGARALSYSESKKIREGKQLYPLEHSEKIVIDDVEGLESLLSKTNNGESLEWGTLLRAYDDKGKAVVYRILDIPSGKKLGLIGEGTMTSMRLNTVRADGEGYNGAHHYHPDVGPRWLGGMDFSIGLNDRFKPLNWINLLTFNLPEGPEIVGFNRRYTYIPADKSQRELVRATPRQIMEYLRV
jgi:hypothetical protein